jgi:BTB/POZ domain-containing protein KCTD9
LNDSLILTSEESVSLIEMSKSSNGILLYRATRDGFTTQAFHSKCDGKGNTITIIKSHLNYVFGGYASSAWNCSGRYINDPNAFLFSLRRDGVSFKDKFTVKRAEYALFGSSSYGPTFGDDICIFNQSNTYIGSRCDFGDSYNLPDGYIYGKNAQDFLAGNCNKWTTTEIEVYQILT